MHIFKQKEATMRTHSVVSTHRNKDVVKEEVGQNPPPNLLSIEKCVGGCALDEMIPIEHPNSIERVSNYRKKRNPKPHTSNIPKFVQEADDTSKRKVIKQERSNLDGILKLLKEIQYIKDDIHGIKAEICDIKTEVSGVKYRIRCIYGNRV